ncbi:MAG: hypothetical protein JSS76_08430 [Bacteroidetes bacterium]|nr:hypothetical protein [Bacteroidota bacterium]
MSVVLQQIFPPQWSWSRNPIIFSMYNPGDASARLRFEVYISDRYAASGWRMVYDGSQTFTDRVTKLDLQYILDSELTFYHNHPLTSASSYTSGNIPGVIYEGQTCKYKVRFGLVTEAYNTWSETNPLWVIKGGLSQDGYNKTSGFIRVSTAPFAINSNPILLHQGLWLQHREAPLQVSFLYREDGNESILKVKLLDASRAVLTTYDFLLESTIRYGTVVHLSMKVDLTGVSYVVYEYTPSYSVGGFTINLAYLKVTPAQSEYRLYSYINSLGGTDCVEIRNNKSESITYEDQVIDIAEPVNGENYPDALVYPQRTAFRRERLVTAGDIAHLMAYFGTKYYKALFHQMRQLGISQDIREYEWGYVNNQGINQNGPSDDGGIPVSDNAYRLVPVTVTSSQIATVNSDNDEPTPFSIELTRSAAESQWLLNQRSCSSNSFTILTGGQRYARLSFLINASAFSISLVTSEAYDSRVGIDNGDGTYKWNTYALAYSTVSRRVVNMDFFYMPHIVTYTSITIPMAGTSITNISGAVPAGTQSFTATAGNIVMFDAILPNGLLTLNLASNAITSMPMLIEGMTSVDLSDNSITGLTTVQLNAIVAAYKVAGAFTLSLQYNSLTQTDLDSLLIALDTSGYTGGHLDIRYQNLGASPSVIGVVALSLLLSKGWTINY